jgi:hypothetical protein
MWLVATVVGSIDPEHANSKWSCFPFIAVLLGVKQPQ